MLDGDLLAGVDVGTQSLRVLVADRAGKVHGRGSAPLTSYRGDRTHEQDPAQWWRALGEALPAALTGVTAAAVRGVAICSTSGTFLLADRTGRPATPALMYDDLRAAALVGEVAAADRALWSRLGYLIQASWALPRLLWQLRHGSPMVRSGLTAGELRLLHCADFLAAGLTGQLPATDWSHALKTGFDLDQRVWPAGVLDRLGLPAAVLPAVVRPGSRIGRVGQAGAAHTGLTAGTPVHAGMTDGCAAQLAAGAVTPGDWNSVLGTTLVVKGMTVARLADPDGVVYSHRHPDGGWLPGGASSTGAGALSARFPGAQPDHRDRAARRYEPAGGLAYPLLGTGERFPFVAPHATGFEIGQFADEDDRYAAYLQGVAFVERLAYARLAQLGAELAGPVAVTGGGSRSAYWCQLRADILGRPLAVPAEPEPALGMAILVAAGDGPVGPPTREMVRVARIVEPRPDASRFDEAYRRFVATLVARGLLDPGRAGDG